MASCAQDVDAGLPRRTASGASAEEILLSSQTLGSGLLQTDLSVPSAHCGGCIAAIEGALSRLDGVVSARLNLSTRRAAVKWHKTAAVPPFIEALAKAGFDASLFSHEEADADPERQKLFRATAVAGFAATNIMLLSVSVWAGAGGEARQIFHLISALLAIPTVAYSGRIFFQSAWAALRSGRTNMDVPISVGILLALALSLHDTIRDGPYAYFDAVTALIFFLLVGRTLDHMMRRKARTAVMGIARKMPRGATVVASDGTRTYKPLDEIEPGELVLVAPGDHVPLDGSVQSGAADIDAALVTGEAMPVPVQPGSAVVSGMLNLNGSLEVRVTRASQRSFISDMIRMMEAAEHGRARYRRLADRAASFYSPVVHGLAVAAFVGWMAATGDWHRALTVAISVLIITCPCALGLAVPMVQIVAARRLFERGIALKDGSALERLAQIDTVVFDKTGTLTMGDLSVTNCSARGRDLEIAAALADRSRHPVARAVAALGNGRAKLDLDDFAELPGRGVQARIGGHLYRLGRAEWALESNAQFPATDGPTGTLLAKDGIAVASFDFSDAVRPQAREAVAALRSRHLATEVLSGDQRESVSRLAASLDIANFRAGLLPQDKVERLEELAREGRKTLMIGDGLNDGPALSAAHVSMAPASAADVGRAAADLVFFGSGLMAVPEAVQTAEAARRLVRQNLSLAAAYNLLVIPVALAGQVTPLMAAVAMSLSSIMVVANALRFSRTGKRRPALKSREAATGQALAVFQ